VNLSLGSGTSLLSIFGDNSLSDGVEYAWTHGSIAVLAAGNTNFFGLGSSNYGNAHALVVGATGPGGEVASYSSPLGNAQWGLVAPGGDDTNASDCSDTGQQQGQCVLSTWPGNKYAWDQGTSMATPHVTGTVALLRAEGLSAAQAVQRILGTAAKVPCGQNCQGRLDTAAAVGLPATPPPSGAQGPAASPLPPGSTTHAPSQSAPAVPHASTPAVGGVGGTTTTGAPDSTTTAPPGAAAAAPGDNPVIAAGAPPPGSVAHKAGSSSSRAAEIGVAIGLLGLTGLGFSLALPRLRGGAGV
ncbi:MAG: S8 family serine peptidase, partial [Acidimicrobiia bacterium]|nr:S8 family serine peptidase [Acidimicrobiia bacterium]